MTTLIVNIKQLCNVRSESTLLRGKELATLPCIENAYLIIEDGIIAEFGEMSEFERKKLSIKNKIDAAQQFVLPTWCDSHTHLVFSASREDEFVDKIKGLTYADIAAKGGGILNSVSKIENCSEDQLFSIAPVPSLLTSSNLFHAIEKS